VQAKSVLFWDGVAFRASSELAPSRPAHCARGSSYCKTKQDCSLCGLQASIFFTHCAKQASQNELVFSLTSALRLSASCCALKLNERLPKTPSPRSPE
jgi:hypothetical protein